jgi:two-component system sensor histidine kinase/response regulator
VALRSILPKVRRPLSSRFTYFVATGLGISFSLTLVFLAWQNAQEDETKQFKLESASLRETVTHSITASDDITHTLATQLEAMGEIRGELFQVFASAILSRYPFIESISYHPLVRKLPSMGFAGHDLVISVEVERLFRSSELVKYRLPAQFQVARKSSQELTPTFDLLSESRFREAVRTAIETGLPLPTPPLGLSEKGDSYMLLKIVSARPRQDVILDSQPPNRIKGVVAVRIDPEYLFGQSGLHSDLSVALFSESEGISGRQILFERRPANPGGWVIASLHEDIRAQFPYYSMRFTAEKQVRWSDLDQGPLILTALVLSTGIGLLPLASAQAKEREALELRERNAEIERQVQQQTQELALARDHALEASRIKSEFLASMSHEIRTPLNAIIGMAELLAETPLTKEQDRYVEVFRTAGEALLSLVDDILDLSKIEARQLVLEAIDFNLRELIEETIEIYALKTDEKGIELICHIAPHVPSYVRGDPARLRQVLLNLIGNAIKFTEKGEIVVRVMQDPADPGSLLFSVTDTGIGIPADKLGSIFESFTQVDSSITRKYGGTGLGLTISKRLVELMGGGLRAESELGKGSMFFFSVKLELAREPEKRPNNLPEVQLQGMRVLVIDDNVTNRLILRETLAAYGAQVIEAQDGPAGLMEFKRAQEQGAGFDLILTDYRMPGMDGFQVAETLKAGGDNACTVLMVASSQFGGHVGRALDIGIGAYLVKPVKRAELIKAINVALSQAPAERRATALPSERPSPRQAPILVVEDTVDNRLLIRAYLKNTPYEVDEAEDGEIAVSKFKAQAYSLVLMDVQMPVMDGYAATQAIRAWEQAQGKPPTPIVALTAHAIKEDIERSKAAGCTAHLTKPIKKATLLQAIEQYVGGSA